MISDNNLIQAVSGVTDPDQIRVLLFINNQQIHAPLIDVVVVAANGAYLPLSGGTLTGALIGTDATFSGALGAAAGTFTGLLTTSGQVAFPATQNPSANANTLDDYEEGTWTPAVQFGGAAVGLTYTSRTGFYTKIGNLVNIQFDLLMSAKGSSTGTATITGLPFNIANALGACHIGFYNALATATGITFSGVVGAGTLTARIPAATGMTTGTDANFTATSRLVGSMTYLT